MKRSTLQLIVALASVLVAISVFLRWRSVSWALVCLLAACLGWQLWQARQFKHWSQRPLQPVDALNETWQEVGNRIAKTIQQSRARTRTLLSALHRIRSTSDYLPDAWVVLQGNHRIEMFNQSAEKLLGFQQGDIGSELPTLIRHPSLSVLLKQSIAEPIEIASPVHEGIQLEVRTVGLDEDRKLVLARDVTELNRLLTMRQDFIANVSHELRTPLTVLRGYVESMNNDNLSSEDMCELSARLVTPVDRMRFMVDDLLTLTKLESAPLPSPDDLQTVNGKQLITQVVDDVSSLLKPTHELEVETDEDLTIECVASEMLSVFTNLVTNAIRYSPDGGTISIRWHDHAGGARFSVQDEGIGIAPEFISRLTERFYRVDMKGSRARGGTGLGLAIVKHVLIRHRSDLKVSSELGVGSTFYFELPNPQANDVEMEAIP